MQLEATGKSVEIAIQNGLLECGMKREDVEVKVLEEGGLFKKAKVVLSWGETKVEETVVEETAVEVAEEIKEEPAVEAEETVVNELKNLGKPYIVLLNSVHPNLPETERLADKLKETYGAVFKLFDTQIPRAIKVAESTSQGKSIFLFDKNGEIFFIHYSIYMI